MSGWIEGAPPTREDGEVWWIRTKEEYGREVARRCHWYGGAWLNTGTPCFVETDTITHHAPHITGQAHPPIRTAAPVLPRSWRWSDRGGVWCAERVRGGNVVATVFDRVLHLEPEIVSLEISEIREANDAVLRRNGLNP